MHALHIVLADLEDAEQRVASARVRQRRRFYLSVCSESRVCFSAHLHRSGVRGQLLSRGDARGQVSLKTIQLSAEDAVDQEPLVRQPQGIELADLLAELDVQSVLEVLSGVEHASGKLPQERLQDRPESGNLPVARVQSRCEVSLERVRCALRRGARSS